MISLKLEQCLVLTLYLIAFHRVASQCQEFITTPMDTIAPLNSMTTCLTCDYPDRTDEFWYRDGTLILPGREAESCDCVVFPNEGRICFNSVSAYEVDEYICEIQVGFGQIFRSSAQLTLAEPPVINKISTLITVVAGETATIPVSVTGHPEPMVQFIRDNEALTTDSGITVEDRQLIISSVDMEDRGVYYINASNIAGIDTHTIRLLVEFIPSITVEQSSEVNNMVTLTFTAVSYPMPDVSRWELSSEQGMALLGKEIFTTTDVDFTVTITVTVPCVHEGYHCVVGNAQGLKRTENTVCVEDTCTLPPQPGPCEAFISSFFFNATSGQCEEFVYGGCRGNDNRFATMKECDLTCDTCSLPADPGPCKAAFPVFFFNSTSQRCERFIYGGCQGNANRFPSLPSCVRRCGERCPNKGEEFQDCVRCPNNRPTCENHDQINVCLLICQPGCDCSFPQVLDEESRACVDPEKCPVPCPPTCSPDFCRRNGRGLCSLPENSKQNLSCGGRCELTICRACYYDKEAREPPNCGVCKGFEVQHNHCFRRWGMCAKRAQSNFERLQRRMRTEENFRCHAPVCALE